jgi:hypothetical protein
MAKKNASFEPKGSNEASSSKNGRRLLSRVDQYHRREELDFRVRNGNGYGLNTIGTRRICGYYVSDFKAGVARDRQ